MIPILIATAIGVAIGFVLGGFFGSTKRANLEADLDEALLALEAMERRPSGIAALALKNERQAPHEQITLSFLVRAEAAEARVRELEEAMERRPAGVA